MTPDRPTREIEPIVPILPQTFATDGGSGPARIGSGDADGQETATGIRRTDSTPPERPQRPECAPADRHREEILPLVPDLR